jgi:hypothetical protein
MTAGFRDEKGIFPVKFLCMQIIVNCDPYIETKKSECLLLSNSSHQKNVRIVATP